MGKKHKHPEHENLERWLVSYADFITLLFATFVVLYALSQADLAKFKQFSQAVKQAFSPAKSVMENPGGIMKGTPDAHILKDSGNSILDKIMPKDTPPKPSGTGNGDAQGKGSMKPVEDTVKAINQDIAKLNKTRGAGAGAGGSGDSKDIGQSSLKVQERGLVISFSSSLFFEPGSAGLKPAAFEILDKVGKVLKSSGSIIHVEGHTDNQPIITAVYPSNWELSTARASSVVRYFTQKDGLDPKTLAAVGYSDTRPVASNDTEAGRRKNRRVDVVILSSEAVKDADAGAAQEGEKTVVFSAEGEGLVTSNATLSKKNKSSSSQEPRKKPAALKRPIISSIKPGKPDIFKEKSSEKTE